MLHFGFNGDARHANDTCGAMNTSQFSKEREKGGEGTEGEGGEGRRGDGMGKGEGKAVSLRGGGGPGGAYMTHTAQTDEMKQPHTPKRTALTCSKHCTSMSHNV
jgi:hypothetical protein